MKHKCPICHKIVKSHPGKKPEEAKFFPFCSERCKFIDLGVWLDAKYKVISKLPDNSSDSPTDERQDRPEDKR